MTLLGVLLASLIGWQPAPAPTSTEIATAVATLNGTATATVGATRTGNTVQLEPTLPPPPPSPPAFTADSSNGRCVGAEPLLEFYSPGWNVARMAGIAYRESRCATTASNSCCSGLLQIHRLWLPQPTCDVYTRNDLYDPATNICVGAIVWRESGYGAWSTA